MIKVKFQYAVVYKSEKPKRHGKLKENVTIQFKIHFLGYFF